MKTLLRSDNTAAGKREPDKYRRAKHVNFNIAPRERQMEDNPGTVKPLRIFETVLYSTDLPAMERFYHEVIGLELISRSELVVSFRCEGSVLLVFDPIMSKPEGRDVPSHGAVGQGHIAFAAREDQLAGWQRRLARAGVEIEQVVDWKQGGRSIYFRDPAGHSVELAPPTLWGGGWTF